MTVPSPELVARLRAAGCVFAEEEAALLTEAAGSAAELEALVARRVAGEPLEQLLGQVEFAGLRLAVGPGAFVPRQRSRLLLAEAVRRCRPGDRVVELCCGVAAIGAALLEARPGIELVASDVDPAPLVYARLNLEPRGGRVLQGDLFDALPAVLRGTLALVVANAPYVPTAEIPLMPVEAREHEPRIALDGGPDGLGLARRIVAEAPGWLAPAGSLLIETSGRQAPELAAIMAAAGLEPEVLRDEEPDATAVAGRMP